jgi:hypothetical protein
VGLHGIDREVEESGDLFQRLVEHVLQDDDAPLYGWEFRKARHSGLDRFLAHQHLHRVRAGGICDIRGGIDRLSHAHGAAAQQIEGAIMRDPEQPGSKRRHLLQALQLKVLQRHQSPGERVLHDVLAVDDRSHETRAIAVQLGPQLAGQSDELRPAVSVQRLRSCAQSANPSIIVTPLSPVSPKAKPLTCVGSSSTATTFSPKALGGIGAPKRATNASGSMSMACA